MLSGSSSCLLMISNREVTVIVRSYEQRLVISGLGLERPAILAVEGA
jgi:hypothetical protein